MRNLNVAAISQDPQERLLFLEEFIGFSNDDRAALRQSAEILGPHLPGILDALYAHLLSFDDTRRIFLGPNGEVNPDYIATRKEHLTQWLLQTVTSADPASFSRYLMHVAAHHTGKAGDAARSVPPRYMVALTGFLQAAFVESLFELLPGRPHDVRRMSIAWNKMLILQLEIFLKVLAPHWPQWDEA